jgi:hypothetical protein
MDKEILNRNYKSMAVFLVVLLTATIAYAYFF